MVVLGRAGDWTYDVANLGTGAGQTFQNVTAGGWGLATTSGHLTLTNASGVFNKALLFESAGNLIIDTPGSSVLRTSGRAMTFTSGGALTLGTLDTTNNGANSGGANITLTTANQDPTFTSLNAGTSTVTVARSSGWTYDVAQLGTGVGQTFHNVTAGYRMIATTQGNLTLTGTGNAENKAFYFSSAGMLTGGNVDLTAGGANPAGGDLTFITPVGYAPAFSSLNVGTGSVSILRATDWVYDLSQLGTGAGQTFQNITAGTWGIGTYTGNLTLIGTGSVPLNTTFYAHTDLISSGSTILTGTQANSTINLTANRHLNIGSATLNTIDHLTPVNFILNSDRDGVDGGAIRFGAITTNGGDVVIGGGSNPSTGYALLNDNNYLSFGPSRSVGEGIYSAIDQEGAITTAGGHVIMNAKANFISNTPITRVIALWSDGNTVTNGGDITINAISSIPSTDLDSHSGGTFFVSSLDAGTGNITAYGEGLDSGFYTHWSSRTIRATGNINITGKATRASVGYSDAGAAVHITSPIINTNPNASVSIEGTGTGGARGVMLSWGNTIPWEVFNLTIDGISDTNTGFQTTQEGFSILGITGGNIQLNGTTGAANSQGVVLRQPFSLNGSSFIVQGTNTAGGNGITLGAGASITSSGEVILAADGNFVNATGSTTPISLTGGGRYLIYSANPANDVLGGMAQPKIRYNFDYGDSTAGLVGSWYLYSLALSLPSFQQQPSAAAQTGTDWALLRNAFREYNTTPTLKQLIFNMTYRPIDPVKELQPPVRPTIILPANWLEEMESRDPVLQVVPHPDGTVELREVPKNGNR